MFDIPATSVATVEMSVMNGLHSKRGWFPVRIFITIVGRIYQLDSKLRSQLCFSFVSKLSSLDDGCSRWVFSFSSNPLYDIIRWKKKPNHITNVIRVSRDEEISIYSSSVTKIISHVTNIDWKKMKNIQSKNPWWHCSLNKFATHNRHGNLNTLSIDEVLIIFGQYSVDSFG